jgi:hypothetical protein
LCSEDLVGLKLAGSKDGDEDEEVDYKRLYIAYMRDLRSSTADMKDMLALQDHYLNKLRLPPSRGLRQVKMVTVGSTGVLQLIMIMIHKKYLS